MVSVVIPVYNSAGTIRETLDSLMAQTYGNWEAICVDDGSTDESVAVINQYIVEHNDLNVRLIKRECQNKGGSVCRNIGALSSQGEYLIFLDADDLLGKDCIENRLKAIETTDNQFVVFPMASFENNDLSTAHVYSRLYAREPLYMFLSGFGTWQVTSPIIRKSFFDKLGGFEETFPRLQDVEFHIRAIIESNGKYEIKRNTDADCYYRQGGNTGVVVGKLKRTIEGGQKLIALIEKYAGQDAIENKKKLSLALLSLYCHLSMYQDKISANEKEYVRTNPVMESGLKLFMDKTAIRMVSIIERIKSFKYRLFVCRLVDKYLRTLLAR